jgi:hypothetical protein
MSLSNLPRAVFEILAQNIKTGKFKMFLQQFPEHVTMHAGIQGQACLIALPYPEHVACSSSSNELLRH